MDNKKTLHIDASFFSCFTFTYWKTYQVAGHVPNAPGRQSNKETTCGITTGIKHLTPSLIEAGEKTKFGSSVINLSSVAGLVGSQLDPLYSMTKGGITTFTKSMAIYFGKKKYPIRINQVHPGIIETDMGKQVTEARINQNPKMTKEESYSSGIMQTPLGRLGTVQEVANTILFLSSDESSFMTGSSLVVDGGLTAQ